MQPMYYLTFLKQMLQHSLCLDLNVIVPYSMKKHSINCQICLSEVFESRNKRHPNCQGYKCTLFNWIGFSNRCGIKNYHAPRSVWQWKSIGHKGGLISDEIFISVKSSIRWTKWLFTNMTILIFPLTGAESDGFRTVD